MTLTQFILRAAHKAAVISSVLAGAVLCSNQTNASSSYQGPLMISSGSADRPAAKVYLPTSHSRGSQKKWPVVLLLHGFSATGDLQDFYFLMRQRVTRRGFILIVPNGNKNREGKPFWNATDYCCDFEQTQVDDTGYLVNLINTVKTRYNGDENRLYVIGHSNGGFMANRLACEPGLNLAGIASLAGAAFKNPALCLNQTPVSMLQIHPHNDGTIQYEGGPGYPSALETSQQWARRNGCDDQPTPGTSMNLMASIPGVDTQTQTWGGCHDETEVALWTLRDHSFRGYNPHIPIPHLRFTERVLDFLFRHKSIAQQ